MATGAVAVSSGAPSSWIRPALAPQIQALAETTSTVRQTTTPMTALVLRRHSHWAPDRSRRAPDRSHGAHDRNRWDHATTSTAFLPGAPPRRILTRRPGAATVTAGRRPPGRDGSHSPRRPPSPPRPRAVP